MSTEIEAQHAAQDQLLSEIDQEVKKQPLIGPVEPIVSLKSTLTDQIFIDKIDSIPAKYTVRRLRGDGNCFYRGFLFGLLAQLDTNTPNSDHLWQKFSSSFSELLVRAGFEPSAVDIFFEVAQEELEALRAAHSLDAMLELLTDDMRSKYLITYLRLCCSAQLRLDHEQYQPFLPEPYAAVDRFCADEVEPCDREVDQLQIQALCAAFGCSIRTVMLDRSPGTAANELVLGEGPLLVTLLFRPGHYDLLLSSSE